MTYAQWSERRIALENKIKVCKHFISKTKDLARKAMMEVELQRHEKDFQRSSIMEQAAKAAEDLN